MTFEAVVNSRHAERDHEVIVAPALWADYCYTCRQHRDDHVGLRPATGQPWCPLLDDPDLTTVTRDEALIALDEGRLDGTSFDPCDPDECADPASHEVGCDCLVGVTGWVK